MMIQGIAFYLFAGLTLASAIMVITARNPVHSVLFLILAFFNSAFLFVLLGAEFLAMILVVVYVGAVAVLFLFVVMMLDVSFAELRAGFARYLPIGAAIGLVLAAELVVIAVGAHLVDAGASAAARPVPAPEVLSNTHALGSILYTDYIFLFQASGLVLLVAMIGAIVLTHRRRSGVLKQKIADQVARRAEDSVEMVKVPTKGGI